MTMMRAGMGNIQHLFNATWQRMVLKGDLNRKRLLVIKMRIGVSPSGLVAIHPIADALAEEYHYFSWFYGQSRLRDSDMIHAKFSQIM